MGFLRYTSDLMVPEFTHERECFACLNRLRVAWGKHAGPRYCDEQATADERAVARQLCGREWIYRRVGHDCREMGFRLDGTIAPGEAGCEWTWALDRIGGQPCVALHGKDGLTCILLPDGLDRWRGNWLVHERLPVELISAAVTV